MNLYAKIEHILEKAGTAWKIEKKYGFSYLMLRKKSQENRKKDPSGKVSYEEWKAGHRLTKKQIRSQKRDWSRRGTCAPCFAVLIETASMLQNHDELSWKIQKTRKSIERLTYKADLIFVGRRDELEEQMKDWLHSNLEKIQKTWIIKCKAGDVLAPDIFYELHHAIVGKDVRIGYCDHKAGDKLCLKPDYSPAYLCAFPYIGPSYFVRGDLFLESGKAMFEADADFSLLSLFLPEKEVFHIPSVLVSAKISDKFDQRNKKKEKEDLIDSYYKMLGGERLENASVEYDKKGLRHIRLSWKQKPCISVLIPNKDHIEDLNICLESLRKQTICQDLEIIVIENNSEKEETFRYYESLPENIRVLHYKGDFNYSKINNYAEGYARGEYILLLNNDIELIKEDSLERLLELASLPNTGAAGARLFYPDGTLQHAGVVIGLGGVAGHAFAGEDGENSGYLNQILCERNVSAVTAACLLVKKNVYDAVRGLEENFAVAFNDVDFCLKIVKTGYEVLYQPACTAYHYESKSRGQDIDGIKLKRFQMEIWGFQKKWKMFLQKGDPWYNRNLTKNRNDYSLGEPYDGITDPF